MTRGTLVALALVCAAFAGVLAGTVHLVELDLRESVDQFAAERFKQVSEAAGILEADLGDIGDDLVVAGQLITSGSQANERERLETMLALVEEYKVIQVYDEAGRRVLTASDPIHAPPPDETAFEAAMDELAQRAMQHPPGDVSATPPLTSLATGWFRIFATAMPRDGGGVSGAVALLVDTEPAFRKVRVIASDSTSRLLLLGVHGRPSPVSDPSVARLVGGDGASTLREDQAGADATPPGASATPPSAPPGFAKLFERMRSGDRGKEVLPGAEAAVVGLPDVEAVAAYAAIHTKGGGHWSLATINSTQALHAQKEAVASRIGLAAGVFALCLLAFGAYVVIGSRRDVALRERLRHADHLAHLHEKTEKILDNIPTGVMALSKDARITAINRALRERVPAARPGASLSEAFPEAAEATIRRLLALVETARPSGCVQSLYGERLALFGQEGEYSLHAVPLEASLLETDTLLVIEDVSEVRALASQLVRAEKLTTVGVLGAGIAHEIGTPLGVVRGRAEYVLGKLGLDHAQAKGMRVIIEQIDVVTRTLRQLLDFSRIKPTAVQPVYVAEVARAVAELLRFEADRRQVTMIVDVDETLPPVAADADQLQQVLVNLLMNSLDACSRGGRVTVSAHGAQTDGGPAWKRVGIVVADDGCGIPERSREQVFDPFFTTKKRGHGTGLGLTIAAQIVRNHGGDLDLESSPGQGTRITLLWPVAARIHEEEHHVVYA